MVYWWLMVFLTKKYRNEDERVSSLPQNFKTKHLKLNTDTYKSFTELRNSSSLTIVIYITTMSQPNL